MEWLWGGLIGLAVGLGVGFGVRGAWRRVRQAQPLRTMSMRNLARGLAHEIRNPLNTLSIRLQLLEEELQAGEELSPDELLEEVRRLRAELNRLERIVEDFHRFARLGVAEKRPVLLAPLLEELLEFVEPEAEQHGIRIEKRLQPSSPVLADPALLRQAFLNLILNAFQAMEEKGGTLTVELLPQGDRVEVRLRDTGPGIPPQMQERIFEPFFSTKPEGTGLGLAVVKQVVDLHDGTIQVRSQPGAGAEFRIQLPTGKASG
ncbi:MAG: hypothetical protein KatS3mg115_1154 [Candidatus Poribacteria bacterium]|nr:MAG: hypothetical protein KatS3mg115_1154 [Candidatus Poribacteria bacterium]